MRDYGRGSPESYIAQYCEAIASPSAYYYCYYYQFMSGTWVAQKAKPANVLPRVQNTYTYK